MIEGKALAASITFALAAIATQAEAGGKCDLEGSYGYVYHGVSYDLSGTETKIAETGSFSTGRKSCKQGEGICGTATATFRFPQDHPNLPGKWVLLKLEFSGGPDAVSVNPDDPCQGTVSFVANGSVTQSNDPLLVGVPLIVNQVRSIAYTASGSKAEIVDLISTSPGSVLAGTAKAQKR